MIFNRKRVSLLRVFASLWFTALLSVAIGAIAVRSSAIAQSNLKLFSTAAAAQSHCPNDEVVWLNTKTGVYHEKGMRWYGRTAHGAFVCRKEADAAGDRDTRNGQ